MNQKLTWKWWIYIFNKVRFNVFFVIMKRVPLVTNLKGTIYQTFY